MLLFDDITKLGHISFENISLDKKSYKNWSEHILIYGISNKTFLGGKTLCIRLDKAVGFIKISDETIYLVLFGSE